MSIEVLKYEPKSNSVPKWRDTAKLSHGYKVIDAEEGRCLVDVRVYYSGQTCRAAVWIRDLANSEVGNGTGSAGGYGYHKSSSAIDSAFAQAGVEFSKRFDGCGTSAEEEAIKAIAAFVAPDVKTHFVDFYS